MLIRTFILLPVLFLMLASCRERNDLKFDSQAWKQADRRAKGRMIPDLHHSKVLMGMRVEEVVEFLGEPIDSSEYFLSYDFDSGEKYLGSNWVYFMNLHIDSVSHLVYDVSWDD